MNNELVIASLVVSLVCLMVVLVSFLQNKKLKSKIDALTLLLKESDKQREAVKREINELRSGSIGMGRKLLELDKLINQQKEKIEEASQQDPQAKLYSRAVKMVELGAGVDELVRECELPKAEAELLLRLHKR